ncbi:Protein STRUBBELIG-RECEPTOR FAMILY 8 [Platanthera guangdongensis]|uniref:Protein STRUBBELIG-RECEPTOR FAMILY 8 n=1 Tax=Platanthera guangdongensis TaxID=2320717 RepID=A0ABR2MWT2_9ASPA
MKFVIFNATILTICGQLLTIFHFVHVGPKVNKDVREYKLRSSPRMTQLKPLPSEKLKADKLSGQRGSVRVPRVPITAAYYSVASLQTATNSFSQEHLIGEGSLGRVYRGVFSNGKLFFSPKLNFSLELHFHRNPDRITVFNKGNSSNHQGILGKSLVKTRFKSAIKYKLLTDVLESETVILAVKKLDGAALSLQDEDVFLEAVSNISHLRHPNVTTLVGYCAEHDQHLLVYEYILNGALHDMLHFSDDSRTFSWNARVKVALGTARALE